MPQTIVQVEDPKNLLPEPNAQITAILGEMFAGNERVIVETQFGGGFSGSYVFKVKPTKAKTAAKSVVVKIASVGQTQQEQRGYQIIRDYWSQLMRVEDQLIISPDGRWAGIRYQMAGDDLFEVKTLLDFVHKHDVDQISTLFKKQLIPLLENAYQNTFGTAIQTYWYPSYTQLLPKNLVITAITSSSTEPVITINADQIPAAALKVGQVVQLDDFEVEKINLADQRLSLTLRARLPWQAYAVWVNGVSLLDDDLTGKIAPTITGRVIKNREDWLHDDASKVLGAGADLNRPALIVTDKIELPNPLHQIHQVLATQRSMRTAHLHGDLNLANILVTDTNQIQFIDFAAARKDHIFHDYLRLETGILTKVVPTLLYRAKRSVYPEQVAELVYQFYGQLHQVMTQPAKTKIELPYPELAKPFEMLRLLRQSARHFLIQSNEWTEYYHGLMIYLLGTLRFPDLETIEGVITPLPKQVAFWGAAVAVSPRPGLEEKVQIGSQTLREQISPSSLVIQLNEEEIFDTAAIRKLLDEALNANELNNLSQNHFPPVYKEFNDEMSSSKRKRLLIEYCTHHNQFQKLVTQLRIKNPKQYQRFFPTIVAPITDKFKSTKDAEKIKAARTLGHLKEPGAIPILEKQLLEQHNPTLRYWLVLAIGEIGGTEAKETLESLNPKLIKQDADPFTLLGIEDALRLAETKL